MAILADKFKLFGNVLDTALENKESGSKVEALMAATTICCNSNNIDDFIQHTALHKFSHAPLELHTELGLMKALDRFERSLETSDNAAERIYCQDIVKALSKALYEAGAYTKETSAVTPDKDIPPNEQALIDVIREELNNKDITALEAEQYMAELIPMGHLKYVAQNYPEQYDSYVDEIGEILTAYLHESAKEEIDRFYSEADKCSPQITANKHNIA